MTATTLQAHARLWRSIALWIEAIEMKQRRHAHNVWLKANRDN